MKTETILEISFAESVGDNSVKLIQRILSESLGYETKIERVEA